MSRLLAAALVLAVAPALTANPVPKDPDRKKVPSLEGTTWSGSGPEFPTVYHFDKGGVLEYSYNGTTYRNGTWKQDGARVTWECNGHYADYDGRVSGDELTASGWNVTGRTWEIKAKRDRPAPAK